MSDVPDLPSASSMYRHANCSGNMIFIRSLREKGWLEEQSSPDATIGERIHAFLEGLPEDLKSSEAEVASDCKTLAHRAAQEFFGPDPGLLNEHYEQRIFYEISGTRFFTGKPDRFFRDADSENLLDINYKTGRKQSITAAENLQLRTEIVLLYYLYEGSVERIGAAIIEPLVTKQPEIVVYDRKALKRAEVEILTIVDKTHWVEKRTAGDWCWFCPARAFCPEAKKLALDEPRIINVEALPLGAAGAEMLGKLEIAYRVLDALWEAYKKPVSEGQIDGWWISEGDKVRFLPNDNRSAFQKRIQENNLTQGIRDATTFHVGKFEDFCGEVWALKGQALKKKFSDLFGDLIGTTRKKGSMERIPAKYAHLHDKAN